MPLIKSAKKRMKQEEKRRERNKAIKSYIKNLRKKTLTLLSSENPKKEEVLESLNYFKSQVDKTWAKGVFKRNKSSVVKSKIDNLFKKKFGEISK